MWIAIGSRAVRIERAVCWAVLCIGAAALAANGTHHASLLAYDLLDPTEGRDCGQIHTDDPTRFADALSARACMADAIANRKPFTLGVHFMDVDAGESLYVVGHRVGFAYRVYRIDRAWAAPGPSPDPEIESCARIAMHVLPDDRFTWATIDCTRAALL